MANYLIGSFVVMTILSIQTILVASQEQPQRKVPGLEYQRNADGSISGSFAASHALNSPTHNGAFGVSQTFSFGPKGASFSGSHSASLNGAHPGGHNFGFSQSNSQAHNVGPNGFSSSGGNAASSHHSNPLFSASQANANAFANQANFNNHNNHVNPFQQQQPFLPPASAHGRRPSRRRNRFQQQAFL